MTFEIDHALEVLSRTPTVLSKQLAGLSEDWINANEGPNTWSPKEVVAHLIVNEETNFLPRTLLILSGSEEKILQPINMTSHLPRSKSSTIDSLLAEFAEVRQKNLQMLRALKLSHVDLHRTATHPKVGEVELKNILSTWVAHDLTHIGQIARVMAKQYKDEVGPFIQFLQRLH